MNLVEQIFEQAKLGTAVDPNANPFLEGRRVGIAQQQVDIAKRQLAVELAQAPLKQTLLQQDAQMNAAKMQLFLEGRQHEAEATQAFAGLAGQVAPLMREGKIDDAQNLIIAAASQNGWLAADARTKALFDYTTKAQDAKLALIQARNAGRAASEFMPTEVLVPSSVPGEPPTRVLRKGPNTSEVIGGEATPSTTEKNFNRMSALQAALEAATAGGDPVAIAKAKRELDTFTALATPASETISLDPKTGAVTVTKGKAPAEFTTAVTNQLQSNVQSALSNIDVADRLEPLITSETVGPRAFVEGFVKDRVLANFYPELASRNRAEATVLAARLRASTIQQLKSDGNISEKEREQILASVPNMEDPLDSPAAARLSIQASRKAAAIGAVVSATKLKQAVPPAAARVLPIAELQRLVKAGVLTQEQALAVFDARNAAQ